MHNCRNPRFIRLTAILLLMLTAAGCGHSQERESIISPMANGPLSETMAESENAQTSADTQNGGQEDVDNDNLEENTMKISVKYEIIYELNESPAAAQLYAQLPLTVEVEPFSNNEMTFYPEPLTTEDTPLSSGEPGSLSYYAPWGDVVMFYAPCTPNGSLYELGTAVSGSENISGLKGNITVSAVD